MGDLAQRAQLRAWSRLIVSSSLITSPLAPLITSPRPRRCPPRTSVRSLSSCRHSSRFDWSPPSCDASAPKSFRSLSSCHHSSRSTKGRAPEDPEGSLGETSDDRGRAPSAPPGGRGAGGRAAPDLASGAG
eukprot:scaffold101544_cov60-Phaeocystis_antarctica.AAC.2